MPDLPDLRSESYVLHMGSSGIETSGTSVMSSSIEIDGLEVFPEHWPAEVDLIISALEAAGDAHDNRRQHPRMSYRVMADLRLFTDPPGIAPWRLYTRDVSARDTTSSGKVGMS